MTSPIEPSAGLRTAAHQLRQLYIALVDVGFTVPEAMAIIANVFTSNANG